MMSKFQFLSAPRKRTTSNPVWDVWTAESIYLGQVWRDETGWREHYGPRCDTGPAETIHPTRAAAARALESRFVHGLAQGVLF